MELLQAIKTRRSVRTYTGQPVERAVMEQVIEHTRFAPSWTNSQTPRWTLIDNRDVIIQIGETAVRGFSYNLDTLKNATGVAILSSVTGVSGSVAKYGIPEAENASKWEVFDAGIACATFCLSAYGHGVATVVMGVIDEVKIAQIIDLPDNEVVAAVIVYGHAQGEQPVPKRKEVSELLRFI